MTPPMIPFVNLGEQYRALESQIQDRITRVLNHGQYIMGPEVGEMEARLADIVGTKHCVSVASGTEALLISLMALDIGPGDEVITTPFTFVATVEVIVLLGITPVFVDIEAETCNIDASKIEAKITSRTKAIMPVSLYGQCSDMDAINMIAARHGGIPVIEDAAQSFGAAYASKLSGNLSTIGCTSFFPSKPLACYGDGGALFTNDDRIAQVAREIRVHGQSERYVHTRVGVGGRMDTLQCAVILAKLERFDWEVVQRQKIGNRYSQALEDLGYERIAVRPGRTSVFAQYTMLVDNREDFQQGLKHLGIPTAVHYPIPLNEQPVYKDYCCPGCTPIASAIARRVVSLPMSADLATEDQGRVIDGISSIRK